MPEMVTARLIQNQTYENILKDALYTLEIFKKTKKIFVLNEFAQNTSKTISNSRIKDDVLDSIGKYSQSIIAELQIYKFNTEKDPSILIIYMERIIKILSYKLKQS